VTYTPPPTIAYCPASYDGCSETPVCALLCNKLAQLGERPAEEPSPPSSQDGPQQENRNG
jgi:hypothetical protein